MAGLGKATHTAHFTECAEAWSGQKVCPRGHTKQEISWSGEARHGRARPGEARPGMARRGAARLHTLPIGNGGQQWGMARLGAAWRGVARRGSAWPGGAGLG